MPWRRGIAVMAWAGLALLVLGSLPYAHAARCPECGSDPCRCGSGGGSRKKSGGSQVGVSVDLNSLFNLFSKPKKKKPPQQPDPAPAAPAGPKIAQPTGGLVALDGRGRPASGTAVPKKDCCEFTALALRNTWGRPISIEIRNQDGQVTATANLAAGASTTLRGNLGRCIRIIVRSPSTRHALIEDVRMCCKDIGQKSFTFYGIQLTGYSSKPCTEGPAGQPKESTPSGKPEDTPQGTTVPAP